MPDNSFEPKSFRGSIEFGCQVLQHSYSNENCFVNAAYFPCLILLVNSRLRR